MSLYTDDDRGVGFLTKHDREFLEDPEGYAADKDHQRQLQYQRKRSIKRRLAQTFVDLTLLTNTGDGLRDDLLGGAADELEDFEESRREKVEEMTEQASLDDFGELEKFEQGTPISALSLLYEFFEDYVGIGFENALGEGVTDCVYRRTDPEEEFALSSANVTIEEPERIDTEYVREKVEKAQYYDLDRAQLLYAIYSATVSDKTAVETEGLVRVLTKSGHLHEDVKFGEDVPSELKPDALYDRLTIGDSPRIGAIRSLYEPNRPIYPSDRDGDEEKDPDE